MTGAPLVLLVLLLVVLLRAAQSQEDPPPPPPPPVDLYCGEMNCYDLLGVTRDSSVKEISKAYRKAAGQWHPDKHQGAEEKKRAEKVFMSVAAGYEVGAAWQDRMMVTRQVLRDEDTRREYDYMLDHPEEMFGNYYRLVTVCACAWITSCNRYYARRLAPRVDVRLVLVALVTIVSALQYYMAWFNFEAAISHLATVPRYRLQALEVARQRWPDLAGRAKPGREREAARAQEAAKVREVIAELMDTHGGYQRPELGDILWVQVNTAAPAALQSGGFSTVLS
jgi:DnaJ family protein C protein 25